MASLSFTDSLLILDYDKNVLLQSNYIASSILVTYVLFTKVIGPRIMKNREPVDLKSLILLYNLFLVASNVYLTYLGINLTTLFWPHRCNIRNSPLYLHKKQFMYIGWFGLFVKYFELLDTVFFVLRKKFNQVSFLHVFHHTTICLLFWISLRNEIVEYYVLLIGAINSFVHILLYTYYGLSALGPGMRKYLWWKKYLTTIQIVQFFIFLFYMIYSFMIDCKDYSTFDATCLVATIIVTALFLNFYHKTYTKPKLI